MNRYPVKILITVFVGFCIFGFMVFLNGFDNENDPNEIVDRFIDFLAFALVLNVAVVAVMVVMGLIGKLTGRK